MSTVNSITSQLDRSLGDANARMNSSFDNMTEAVEALTAGYGEGDVSIDETLTTPGAAADASVVGERFGRLSNDLAELTRTISQDALLRIDFSNWLNGSFVEEFSNGEKIVHTVTFDHDGIPATIDGTAIYWG